MSTELHDNETEIIIEEPSSSKKRTKRILHAFSSVAFLIGLIVFFLVGAVFDSWGKAWIAIVAGVCASIVIESMGDLLFKKNILTACNTLIMLVSLILFFVIGFVFGKWHPGWVVFPIGAILCGIVSALYSAFKR